MCFYLFIFSSIKTSFKPQLNRNMHVYVDFSHWNVAPRTTLFCAGHGVTDSDWRECVKTEHVRPSFSVVRTYCTANPLPGVRYSGVAVRGTRAFGTASTFNAYSSNRCYFSRAEYVQVHSTALRSWQHKKRSFFSFHSRSHFNETWKQFFF